MRSQTSWHEGSSQEAVRLSHLFVALRADRLMAKSQDNTRMVKVKSEKASSPDILASTDFIKRKVDFPLSAMASPKLHSRLTALR